MDTLLNDETSCDIKLAPRLKKAWSVGPNTVVVIDKSIIATLGITEDNTLFEQEIVDGGIFLRIVRKP